MWSVLRLKKKDFFFFFLLQNEAHSTDLYAMKAID